MVKLLFADKVASAEGINGTGSGRQPGQPNPDAQLQITAQLPDGRTVHIHSSALGAAMAQDGPRDGTSRGAAGGIMGGAAFTHQVGGWSGRDVAVRVCWQKRLRISESCFLRPALGCTVIVSSIEATERLLCSVVCSLPSRSGAVTFVAVRPLLCSGICSMLSHNENKLYKVVKWCALCAEDAGRIWGIICLQPPAAQPTCKGRIKR